MGSMGFWELVNFWTMGSGTHQFWEESTKTYPHLMNNEIGVENLNPSIWIAIEASEL